MAKQTKKTCGTCRYGKFERTPTGQAKREQSGRCLHPHASALYTSDWVKSVEGHFPLAVLVERPIAGTIWPDYTDCGFWEKE